jgi:hypothetical protein
MASEQHDNEFSKSAQAAVAEAMQGLAFGEVHITVHDSQVVRVERIERIRLEPVAKGDREQGGLKGGERR